MSDFVVDIDTNSTDTTYKSPITTLLIESTENNILEIEATFLDNVNNIEIERYNYYDLTVSNTFYGQLPDQIPITIITGNLDVNRIDNLDLYLSTIPIDGGSP
jgi:hypothetical protein